MRDPGQQMRDLQDDVSMRCAFVDVRFDMAAFDETKQFRQEVIKVDRVRITGRARPRSGMQIPRLPMRAVRIGDLLHERDSVLLGERGLPGWKRKVRLLRALPLWPQ